MSRRSLTGQTIPAGSSTYTFDVTVNGDNALEPNETFFVNVTNVTGATVADGQGQGTITNDDTPGHAVDRRRHARRGQCRHHRLHLHRHPHAAATTARSASTWTITAAGRRRQRRCRRFRRRPADHRHASPSPTARPARRSPSASTATPTSSPTRPSPSPSPARPAARRSATAPAPARSPTTMSPPAASIADAAIVEGNNGVTYLVFTVTLDHASTGAGHRRLRHRERHRDRGQRLSSRSAARSASPPARPRKTISVPIIGDDHSGSQRDVHRHPLQPVRRRRSATAAPPARSPTTTARGYYPLAGGTFSQNWTNTGQITANDNWSGVPFIIGYLGDIDAASPTNVDPRTLTGADLRRDRRHRQPDQHDQHFGRRRRVPPRQSRSSACRARAPPTRRASSSTWTRPAAPTSASRPTCATSTAASTTPPSRSTSSTAPIRTAPGPTCPGAYFADVTAGSAPPRSPRSTSSCPPGANGAATLEIRIMTTNAGRQ